MCDHHDARAVPPLAPLSHPTTPIYNDMDENDTALEDEKKDFDAEQADESQPDPDEPLMMESGNGRVWLVKVSPPASRCARTAADLL